MSNVYNRAPIEHLEAKQALAERIKQGLPAPVSPRKLSWQEIETIPAVFQQRRIVWDTTEAHVQTLAQAIKMGPRGSRQASLEPVAVYWVGNAWACVDGHHRLMAYALVKHQAMIPVKVLRDVTLDEAIRSSLGNNSKDKLPLSPRCRTEAAWLFVVGGGMSKSAIASLAGVNESTIANMRQAIRRFEREQPGATANSLTWAKMRCWKGKPVGGDFLDVEQAAAERLLRHTERHLKGVSAGVLLLALELYRPGLVASLFQLHQQLKGHNAYDHDPFPAILSDIEMNPDF